MAEFDPITTQEEYQARFNSDLGDRLKKNEEKWSKKYEGFLSPDEVAGKTAELEETIKTLTAELSEAQKTIESHSKDIEDRDARIKGFEIQEIKNRIALETGLTHDAIGFINGDNEEAIRSSAEALKSLVGSSTPAHPFVNEPKITDGASASIRALAQSLNNK